MFGNCICEDKHLEVGDPYNIQKMLYWDSENFIFLFFRPFWKDLWEVPLTLKLDFDVTRQYTLIAGIGRKSMNSIMVARYVTNLHFYNKFKSNVFQILLPNSVLDQLVRMNIQYPMLFKITNRAVQRVTHCGVLEFLAEEGHCYLPSWVWLY